MTVHRAAGFAVEIIFLKKLPLDSIFQPKPAKIRNPKSEVSITRRIK
jgi:hypothetical protein